MSKFTRLVAIGAIAALPAAVVVPSASAQTPAQYGPYTPQVTPQEAAKTAATEAAADAATAVKKLTAKKLFGTTKSTPITLDLSGPGTYEIKVTGRLPGKKTKTLSQGKLIVTSGSTAKTGKVSVKRTGSGKTFNSTASKKKFKGKTIPVKITVTYTSLTGVKSTITVNSTVKK